MEILSVAEVAKKIQIYLQQSTMHPYFVVADGEAEYSELTKILSACLEKIRISDFCAGDSPLDTDLLIEWLKSLSGNSFVVGLGEYIFFTAQENILRSLQDRSFNRKIVFVCRGVATLLERLADEDLKFRTNNVSRVVGTGNFSVVKYSPKLKLPTDAKNFSKMLKLMESGRSSLTVQSDLPLVNVKEINTFHDAIKGLEPHFDAPASALPADLWQEYFSDKNCVGYPPEHWRTFAAGFKNKIDNPYLKYVFAQSADFDAYRRNLFFALLEVDDDKLFAEFYPQRKAIVKNISSPHLDGYLEILANFPASEALKYLTDNTAEERRAMIQAVCGSEKIPELLTKNYPALNDYLADYDFGDGVITAYFRWYKSIKLRNVDDKNFKQAVQEVAANRPYNRFDTRQTILDKMPPNAKLYWLDALGVEFLSYIKAQASRFGLSIEIQVARAELPTLTAMNKNFYDEWRGDKFDKNSKLDELKHSPEKFDAEGCCSEPTYLADELAIIDDVLTEIKHALTARRVKKIVLTSDHGASRLAVMFGREINFRMNSVGEHSGRCCPINEVDKKPPLVTEENGYWVMAGYDRFAGGRLSSVEVHGGATLEEILVPVITFQR